MRKAFWGKILAIGLVCVPAGASRICAGELKGFSEPIAIPVWDADSEFNALAKRFEDEGILPSEQEVAGWHSGRMYGAGAPNQPSPTLLVGATRPDSSQGSFFRLFPFLAINKDPDYYDRITDEIKRDVCGSVASGWDRWSKPTPEGRSLVFSSAASHRFEERKVAGGVIEKWINPQGRVVAYSLYSKDVTPIPRCSP